MRKVKEKTVIKDLKEVIPLKQKYLSYLTDKEFGFNYSWDTFVRLLKTFCSPQSYGVRIQNRWKKENGAITVKCSENRGDVKKAGVYYELKSTINSTDGKINIVQIRPHQDVEYKILAFDMRDEKTIGYQFGLYHEQMLDEIKKIGQSAHGTADAIRDNKTKEYAIRMTIGDDNFNRWVSNYLEKIF